MIDYNQKINSGNCKLIAKRDMDAMHYWHFTFVSIAGVIRGSHVTTIDGARFCGADDNVGGFGNVLVTGRQTQANIFFALLLSININSVNDIIQHKNCQCEFQCSIFMVDFF